MMKITKEFYDIFIDTTMNRTIWSNLFDIQCYKILKNNGLHIYTVPYGVFLSTPKYEEYGTGLTSLVACIKPQFINGDTHME
jgi:hypothetical protein